MAYLVSQTIKLLSAVALGVLISGCQSKEVVQSAPDLAFKSVTSPTNMVVTLAKTAQKCWFKSKDPAFRGFKLASEVNSYAGRPRFLLVPRNNPGGLPKLVVQAERAGNKTTGRYTKVETFGPLLQSKNGNRIAGDVKRWADGNRKCTAIG